MLRLELAFPHTVTHKRYLDRLLKTENKTMRLTTALFAFILTLALAACSSSSPTSATGSSAAGKVGHVFIIVLENKSYATTFPATGTPPAPYLAQTLPAMGALLTQYHGTGHVSLDNYITMVGGQESARSTLHLAELFRLADKAGLLRDPAMAVARMRAVLAVRGVEA